MDGGTGGALNPNLNKQSNKNSSLNFSQISNHTKSNSFM